MKKLAIIHNLVGSFSNFLFLFLTSIVLLPYYFKFISIQEYGIWLGGISFLSLVSVLEANISLILTQQLGKKWTDNEPIEFSKYLTAALFFGIVVGLIILVFTYLIKGTLVSWVNPEKYLQEVFVWSFFQYALSLSLTIISSYVNSVSQVFLKTLLPPFFNIFASIVGIAYTVLTIPTQGIIAIASGNLIRSFLMALLSSIYAVKLLKEKEISFSFEIGHLIKLVRNIGLPFMSKVGMTLAMNIQNFIIATTISASATTIFDITRKLPLMTQMVINMIGVSTFTSFSLLYAEQKLDTGVHEYTKHFFSIIRILLLISLAAIFLIGQDFITIWVGIDKFGGNILLALLCINALSDQIRNMLSQQYYAIGRFNLTAKTDSIFAITFILIAVILIPTYHLNGIVVAGIIANIVYYGVCFYLERKHNIEMIANIINRSFMADLIIIIIITLIAKFAYDSFRGNYIIGILIILIANTLLLTIIYIKERPMINFLVLKLKRK
jgi:O-antigen/teichoic acid export membrane protein